MAGLITPLCLSCAHFMGVLPGVGYACQAFGEARSIPPDILANAADHRLAYPGDGGKRYTPVDTGSRMMREMELMGWVVLHHG